MSDKSSPFSQAWDRARSLGGVSRRELFRGVAIAAGGAAALAGMVTAAQAKMTEKAAGYQETPGKDGSNCSTCALFQAPSSCTLIDGTISPNGWCRFYSKKS